MPRSFIPRLLDALKTDEAGESGRRWRMLVPALIIAVGVGVHLPSLWSGFIYDDYTHQLGMRHSEAALFPWWNLYDFGERPQPGDAIYEWGYYPWWTDADYKIRFFRPVTSLSLLLDYKVYGDWAVGYHATNLAIFAVFLLLAYRFYLVIGLSGRAALWALAFLAFEDNHVMPVYWIANRNTLWAGLFVVASMLCLDRHLVRRSTAYHRLGYLGLALICFLLACGSKESGIVAFPMAVLYLLLLGPEAAGKSLRQSAAWVLRSPAFWSFTCVAVGFLGFYLWAGYGTRSVFYRTPWGQPWEYLSQFAVLVPIGLLSLSLGFMSDTLLLYPEWTVWVAGVGVVVLFAVGRVLFRGIGWSRRSCFALAWAILPLTTLAGAQISDRLFFISSIGTSLLLGLFFERLAWPRKMWLDREYGRLGLAGLVMFTGLIGSVPASWVRASSLIELSSLDRQAILEADIDPNPSSQQDVLLLNCPSSLIALSMLPTWSYAHYSVYTRIHMLQMGRRGLVWKRTGDKTMELTSMGSPFGDQKFEGVCRSDSPPPPVGVGLKMYELTATPLEVEGNGVRKVGFTFRRNLDDAGYVFLAWDGERLARVAVPAIGQTIELAPVEPLFPFAP